VANDCPKGGSCTYQHLRTEREGDVDYEIVICTKCKQSVRSPVTKQTESRSDSRKLLLG